MKSYKVDILTPSSTIVRNVDAESLLVPTTRGQINLLEDHTHLITKLETGILTLIDGKAKRSFSMTTGICKVLNNRVTILSSATEEAHLIDVDRAKLALTEAQEKLKSGSLSDFDLTKYQRKVARAQMRLKAASFSKNA